MLSSEHRSLLAEVPELYQPSVDAVMQRLAELEAENKTLRDGWESVKRDRDDAWAERDEARAKVERLREHLSALFTIIDHSHGVAGWHLNGDIAAWDEFEEVFEARAALEPREGEEGK